MNNIESLAIDGGRTVGSETTHPKNWWDASNLPTEPVKLSRERWDSLLRSYADYREPMAHFLLYKQIEVVEPREGDGITFLPATYVPTDFPIQRGGQKYLTCAWNYDGTRLR